MLFRMMRLGAYCSTRFQPIGDELRFTLLASQSDRLEWTIGSQVLLPAFLVATQVTPRHLMPAIPFQVHEGRNPQLRPVIHGLKCLELILVEVQRRLEFLEKQPGCDRDRVAWNDSVARVGLIDRSKLGSIDFGLVGSGVLRPDSGAGSLLR
jgi:hypothetical protein